MNIRDLQQHIIKNLDETWLETTDQLVWREGKFRIYMWAFEKPRVFIGVQKISSWFEPVQLLSEEVFDPEFYSLVKNRIKFLKESHIKSNFDFIENELKKFNQF